MRFEVLDTSRGDVLAAYATYDEAAVSLAAYLSDHAGQVDDLAVATVDGSGKAVRLTPAAAMLADGSVEAG